MTITRDRSSATMDCGMSSVCQKKRDGGVKVNETVWFRRMSSATSLRSSSIEEEVEEDAESGASVGVIDDELLIRLREGALSVSCFCPRLALWSSGDSISFSIHTPFTLR